MPSDPPDRKLVFIVDDDRDGRDALADVLRDEGYSVEAFADGASAIDRLRREPLPGLIFLDVMMPRMSGAEFCQLLQGIPRAGEVPIVILSGLAQLNLETAYTGAVAVLFKPPEIPVLLACVRRYCG